MPKKILVVDDNDGILSAFDALLSDAGYTVITSSSGDCLEKLTRQNLPDLLLLDVLLSGSDGREICQRLKSQNLTKNVPIIMISAHPGVAESIREIGADDFLAKPFEMKDLLEKVSKHIK